MRHLPARPAGASLALARTVRPSRTTNCCGPLGIDGSAVAADTLQLDLNLSRELRVVEGKPRGGRVLAHWYSRRRVSDVQGFRRGGRGRSQGGGCRGSIVGWDLRLRCWRTDVHI